MQQGLSYCIKKPFASLWMQRATLIALPPLFINSYELTSVRSARIYSCLIGGSLTGTTREYLLHRHLLYYNAAAFSASRFKSYLPHISSQGILQPMDSSLCGESMYTPLSHHLYFIDIMILT